MKFYKALYYISLVFGLLLSFFFTFFLIVDGITDLTEGKADVIPMLIMMIPAVAGYVWSIFNPFKGSLLMIISGLIMAVYLLIMGGPVEWQMALIFGLPYIVSGLLIIIAARKIPIIKISSLLK